MAEPKRPKDYAEVPNMRAGGVMMTGVTAPAIVATDLCVSQSRL